MASISRASTALATRLVNVVRSPEITKCTPTALTLPEKLVQVVHQPAAVVLAVAGHEGFELVDQNNYRRARVADPEAGPAVDQRAEHVHQPGEPVGVVSGNHRPAVREGGQGFECPVAAVDGVQVQVGRSDRAAQASCDGAQRGGPTAAHRPADQDRTGAAEVELERLLGLRLGDVDQSDHGRQRPGCARAAPAGD